MSNPGDLVECQTCHGQYMPVQPDGTLYFHACPPLGVGELRDALAAKTVTLPARDALRLQAALSADAAAPVPAGEVSRADAVLASLSVPRPNMRDENVVSTREKDKGKLKAAGLGAPLAVDAATGAVAVDV